MPFGNVGHDDQWNGGSWPSRLVLLSKETSYHGDKGKMVWVRPSVTGHLDKEVKKLYEDFCVSRDGKYGCPRTFNMLTPAWYLNHSKKPNVAADENYDFYSARRIKKGEELTVDYDTYSDI